MMFVGYLRVTGLHGRLQLLILMVDELGSRLVADSEVVLLAVAEVLFLPFRQK